eukprot:Amastigsp_a676933_13.p3 type:complete len:163 gc:universal Amastigsp_a676933_13:493-981(+)
MLALGASGERQLARNRVELNDGENGLVADIAERFRRDAPQPALHTAREDVDRGAHHLFELEPRGDRDEPRDKVAKAPGDRVDALSDNAVGLGRGRIERLDVPVARHLEPGPECQRNPIEDCIQNGATTILHEHLELTRHARTQRNAEAVVGRRQIVVGEMLE